MGKSCNVGGALKTVSHRLKGGEKMASEIVERERTVSKPTMAWIKRKQGPSLVRETSWEKKRVRIKNSVSFQIEKRQNSGA